MNCVIDNVISMYLPKGKKLDVIKRYLQMRYRIHMDMASLKERIRAKRMNFEMS